MMSASYSELIIWIATCYVCFSIVYSKCVDQNVNKSHSKMNEDPSEYYGNLSSETIRKIQKCDRDMESMELCMRCAKVTKSLIVYPMCCNNEDSVKGWCYDYIYYGTRK